MAIFGVIWSFLAPLLQVLLPALIKAWQESQKSTEVDATPNPLRDEFRKRVLDAGWGKAAAVLLLCLMLAAGTGGTPATRTIYVPHGDIVRLRATVPKAKVWVLDKSGNPVEGEIDLLEGWYAGSMEKP